MDILLIFLVAFCFVLVIDQIMTRQARRIRITKTKQSSAEAESERLYNHLWSRCEDCGGKANWFEGPSGGLSTNIFCGHCGQGYNVTPIAQRAEKIHKDTHYIVGEQNGETNRQIRDGA